MREKEEGEGEESMGEGQWGDTWTGVDEDLVGGRRGSRHVRGFSCPSR